MAANLTSYKQRYESARNSLARIREASKLPMQRGMQALSGVAGGALAGVIDAKQAVIPGTELPTTPLVGGLFVGLALLNAEESWSEMANSAGAGMLAVATAKQTYKWAAS